MQKKRNRYTPEEKVAIMRRHLIDKVTISHYVKNTTFKSLFTTDGKKNFLKMAPPPFNLRQKEKNRPPRVGSPP